MFPLSTLPAELLIIILELLSKDVSESGRKALAIFNLAVSSRDLFEFVASWASCCAKEDIYALCSTEGNERITHPEHKALYSLRIFCKRLGEICALCGNRRSHNEFFTNLQICQVCDPFHFPKISYERIKREYWITPTTQKFLMRNLPSRFLLEKIPDSAGIRHSFGPIYRWSDIRKIILTGDLRPRLLLLRAPPFERGDFNAEEFGYYTPSDSRSPLANFWPDTLVWAQSCRRWKVDKNAMARGALRPSVLEGALYNEFRYRFDCYWRLIEDETRGMIDYILVCRHWSRPHLWGLRPWRISNFPLQPRCLETVRKVPEEDKWQSMKTFNAYQLRCSKLRAVIKTFPDIFCSPQSWLRCLSDEEGLSIEDAVALAKEERRNWTAQNPQDQIFYLKRNTRSYEVDLIEEKDVKTLSRNAGYFLDKVKIQGDQPQIVHEI